MVLATVRAVERHPTSESLSIADVDYGNATMRVVCGATNLAVGMNVALALEGAVVRDANGLYALTARCPHQGFTTRVQGNDFVCPRHGSLFSFDGAVLTGPATAPLVHYAMCTLDNGHVGVLTSQTVSESQRLDA